MVHSLACASRRASLPPLQPPPLQPPPLQPPPLLTLLLRRRLPRAVPG
jgi:hypothetical protein